MTTRTDAKSKDVRKKTILKKKPVRLPSVINGVKVSEIPAKTKLRLKLLKKELKVYQGEKLYCPSLRTHVLITGNSVAETSYHASHSVNSTVAALSLKQILKNARFLKATAAKDNGRQKSMDIKQQKILFCPLKDFGIAKITVGEMSKGGLVHYCITSIVLEKFINEE